MVHEALIERLTALWPESPAVQGNDWPELTIPAAQLLPVIDQLRTQDDLSFDYLFCLTCVDWKTHFTMVYHLESTKHRHNMVLKVTVNREQPEIETICHLYRTAELLEREVFDLFGVVFLHHPDLRRLLLTEDWKGYPLRKDYEDPINMIKL